MSIYLMASLTMTSYGTLLGTTFFHVNFHRPGAKLDSMC